MTIYISINKTAAKITDCLDCCLPDAIHHYVTNSPLKALWIAKKSGRKIDIDSDAVQEFVNRERGYYHCFEIVKENGKLRAVSHTQAGWDSIRLLHNRQIISI